MGEGICGFKNPKKFVYGNEGFPVLYDNGQIRVYKNPTDEVFVEDLKSGMTMRINSYHHIAGGLQFTTEGRVEPVRVSNTIGWSIRPR